MVAAVLLEFSPRPDLCEPLLLVLAISDCACAATSVGSTVAAVAELGGRITADKVSDASLSSSVL